MSILIRIILLLFALSVTPGCYAYDQRLLDQWLKDLQEFTLSEIATDYAQKSPSEAFLELEPYDKIFNTLPFMVEYHEWLNQLVRAEKPLQDHYYVVYHACTGLSLFQDLLKLAVEKQLNIVLPEDYMFLRVPWKEIYDLKDVGDYFEHYGQPHVPDSPFSVQKRWVEICLTLLEDHSETPSFSEQEIKILYRAFRLLWLNRPLEIVREAFGNTLTQSLFPGSEDLKAFETSFHLKVGIYSEFDSEALLDVQKLRYELIQLELCDQKRVSDYCAEIQDHLLAVNLTLFGNYDTGGDCTLEYWHSSRNHMPKQMQSLLMEILQVFDLGEEAIGELQEIYSLIEPEDSVILAIFIPKHLIDRVMYLSYGFYDRAIPYNDPSAILSQYQAHMQDVASYKTLEGRLVFTQRYLLNPFSGIKLYRHHVIQPENYRTYQEKLKNWAEDNFKA